MGRSHANCAQTYVTSDLISFSKETKNYFFKINGGGTGAAGADTGARHCDPTWIIYSKEILVSEFSRNFRRQPTSRIDSHSIVPLNRFYGPQDVPYL